MTRVTTLLLAGLVSIGVGVGVACRDKPALEHYGHLPNFALQDQFGREFTHKNLAGRVVMVDFIFTSCPDVCPLLTEQLVSLRKQMPADQPLSYISISVDPEHDTPERLRSFAAAHGAVADNMWFLTGPFAQVKAVVTQGFKQAMELQPAAEGQPRNVLHGSHFVLVDTQGELRGFFPNDSEGHAALKRAALALLTETPKP
jgi:protein SCO1/2